MLDPCPSDRVRQRTDVIARPLLEGQGQADNNNVTRLGLAVRRQAAEGRGLTSV